MSETFEQLQARAQKVIDNLGKTTPQSTPQGPGQTQFESIISQAQADLNDLKDETGRPRHVADEEAKRRAAIQASVASARTEYEAPLIEAQRTVKAELDQIKPFDPGSVLATLNPEELTRANGLRQFIQDDVAKSSPEDLASAIEAAIETDDRAALVVYLRELPKLAMHDKRYPLANLGIVTLRRGIEVHLIPQDDGRRAALQKQYADLVMQRSKIKYATENFSGARHRMIRL